MIAFAAACTEGGSRPDPEMIALENEGIACLHGDDPLAFAANRPIEVRVDWEGVCLSGSCTTDKVSTCMATVSGQTVTLVTRASWTDITAQEHVCTADCGLLSATCETTALPAGDYTFTLGARTTQVTVPSQVSSIPCVR